ncbi:hypothetical protein HAX54_036545 [Datura stramonium]|uniref:Uncharacterized protein n=1 Tax=Datura stramonium TaxID=4076 RepID=A0ABS8SGG2_DATST|nr:hypothetical protein [Datura stramonium]
MKRFQLIPWAPALSVLFYGDLKGPIRLSSEPINGLEANVAAAVAGARMISAAVLGWEIDLRRGDFTEIEFVRRRILLLLDGCIFVNLENGSGGAAVASAVVVEKGDLSDAPLEKGEKAGDGEVIGDGPSSAAAAAALVVEKGDFSDALLEKGEKAGDGEVICEMAAGPSSTAAMAAVVDMVKGDSSDTLLEKGEKAGDGEMAAGPSLVAAMAVVVEEEGGELRVTLLGEGSVGEEIGEGDFLFRDTVLPFMMLQFSPVTATAAVVTDRWRRRTAEERW